VISYVTAKYGRENVSQIITFGTMAARGVIRDTGRGLEMPYSEVDRIARMVPNELNMTLGKALEQSRELRQLTEESSGVRDVVEVARRLEGLARHASMHAAGVVIAPRPLTELVPLYKSGKDEIMTMYPMTDIEKIGLLKMDFLALTTLTVIDHTLRMLRNTESIELDMESLALDDGPTNELFSNGVTSGVFQVESSGMKDILRRFRPSSIEHLTALNALYRPGPIGGGMIDDFIKRRHGVKKIAYELPELEPILEETYGVIVYQEQVMQIANRVAGYSMGEADLLRRAMGKKKAGEMAAQREKFLEGARTRGFSKLKKVTKIFDLMEQFAGYGFNKSHSAAYAVLAYRTAYLKAHYPAAFMAAVLTSERGNTEKVVKYINECREMSIPILSPDINVSRVDFTPADGSIRFGLAAIKNVGETAIRSIVERKPFRTLFDFCERVDLRLVNKRVIESLIKAGAFDSLGVDRARLYNSVDRALEWGQRKQREAEVGQGGLFAALQDPDSDDLDMLAPADSWSESLRLVHEKETLGFYITGHPIRQYGPQIETLANATTADLAGKAGGSEIAIGGIVAGVRTMRTKKGNRMGAIQLEDLGGVVEVLVFPDLYARIEGIAVADRPVIVTGRLDSDESGTRILASEIFSIEDAVARLAKRVTVVVESDAVREDLAERLRPMIEEKTGSAELLFELRYADKTVFVRPNAFLKVTPDREFVDYVEGICGPNAVKCSR
jgi:DNA polymerase-3 subunit alpha